ncbi:hypothetical protein C5S53_13240 [Methanophagales archaeon]|nr:hypothetical protein C5S53_13240 [Methanophagales archaeon]
MNKEAASFTGSIMSIIISANIAMNTPSETLLEQAASMKANMSMPLVGE